MVVRVVLQAGTLCCAYIIYINNNNGGERGVCVRGSAGNTKTHTHEF